MNTKQSLAIFATVFSLSSAVGTGLLIDQAQANSDQDEIQSTTNAQKDVLKRTTEPSGCYRIVGRGWWGCW